MRRGRPEGGGPIRVRLWGDSAKKSRRALSKLAELIAENVNVKVGRVEFHTDEEGAMAPQNAAEDVPAAGPTRMPVSRRNRP